MCKKIHLDAPNVGELEKRYLENAVDNGYVSTIGPLVSEFEEKFAGYLGVKKAVSTQSGTSAIHMALHELGIKKGDEVIVPALTFVATVNPVIYVGGTPVFVDVDSETWTINPEEIEKSITERTKVVVAVHLYGSPCNMAEILKIAKKHDIYVIEDAAESLGATCNGKQTGSFGDFGCFSFNGNKIITTGGGGMVVGHDEEKLRHIKFLANQAKDEKGYHPEIGFNNRMTNIEAALGLAQIERLDEFLKKKKAFNNIYRQELKIVKSCRFQEEYPDAESSWWLSCVMFEKDIDIAVVQEELKKKGIVTRGIFAPVVEFPPYHGYKQTNYENSYRIYERSLSLPSSTLNSEDDIYYVCKKIKEIISG